MKRSLRTVLSATLPGVLALVLGLGLAGCGSADSGQKSQQSKKPPLPVKVESVQPHSVDVYSEYPGRVRGKRTVQVVARVQGILQSQHYEEGRVVKKGQLLYQIDPRPFQATVDQRKGQLASAKAKLAKNRRSWKRIRHLYKANAVSQSKRDMALSEYQSSKADVQEARANLESAQIDLGYTHVAAPLTGVTSLRETDVGSLVNDGTKLTTITQLDPIYIRFALPEDDAIARNTAIKERGKKTTSEATRQATVILPNGKPYKRKGKVDFTQSTINPQTGTVQLRAVVKNPNNALMPGRYVRVRLRIETRDNAIVVPEKAVFSGQKRSQVYVAKNGKAKAVNVELGPDVDSGRIIDKGLSKGDKVIVSGLGKIKPDAPVKVTGQAQRTSQAQRQTARAHADKKMARAVESDGLQMAGAGGLTRAARQSRQAG